MSDYQPQHAAAGQSPAPALSPARRVIRTVVQVALALAVLAPIVLDAVGVRDVVIGGASVLAIAAAITRVMALPAVEVFLRRFLPWLAADPADR
ncbi:MAG TPA: hypothetical protein VFH70_07760 [Acidimicrobiales bacterium]|nr:hypothetical protein [Acidimicrobiales bacterium]